MGNQDGSTNDSPARSASSIPAMTSALQCEMMSTVRVELQAVKDEDKPCRRPRHSVPGVASRDVLPLESLARDVYLADLRR